MDNHFELFNTVSHACVDDRLASAIRRVLEFRKREVTHGLGHSPASLAGLVDTSVSPHVVLVRLCVQETSPRNSHHGLAPHQPDAAVDPSGANKLAVSATAVAAVRQSAQGTDRGPNSIISLSGDQAANGQHGSKGGHEKGSADTGSGGVRQQQQPDQTGALCTVESCYEAYGKIFRAPSLDRACIPVSYRRCYLGSISPPAPNDRTRADAAGAAATNGATATLGAEAAFRAAQPTYITCKEEATSWLVQHASLLSAAQAEQLRDFSEPSDPIVRLLAHTLMAIADWVLAPQSLTVGPGTGLTPRGSVGPAVSPAATSAAATAIATATTTTAVTAAGAASPPTAPSDQSLLVRLRPWAFAIRRNDAVRLLGGCVRPALRMLASRTAAGAPSSSATPSLLELLNAPPLRYSVAREVLLHGDDDHADMGDALELSYRAGWTVPLQRLSAMMKQFHGKTDGPLLIAARRVRSCLEPLLVGDPIYGSSHGHQQSRQGLDLRAAGTATSGSGAPGSSAAGGVLMAPSGSRRLTGSDPGPDVAAFLRDLGANDDQLLEVLAMDDIDANVGFCVECGGMGELVACDTCVDSFCRNCLGVGSVKTLSDPWSCSYCKACAKRDSAANSGGGARGGLTESPPQKLPSGRTKQTAIRSFILPRRRTSARPPQPAARGRRGSEPDAKGRVGALDRGHRPKVHLYGTPGGGGGGSSGDRSRSRRGNERLFDDFDGAAVGGVADIGSMTSDTAAQALIMLHRQLPYKQPSTAQLRDDLSLTLGRSLRDSMAMEARGFWEYWREGAPEPTGAVALAQPPLRQHQAVGKDGENTDHHHQQQQQQQQPQAARPPPPAAAVPLQAAAAPSQAREGGYGDGGGVDGRLRKRLRREEAVVAAGAEAKAVEAGGPSVNSVVEEMVVERVTEWKRPSRRPQPLSLHAPPQHCWAARAGCEVEGGGGDNAAASGDGGVDGGAGRSSRADGGKDGHNMAGSEASKQADQPLPSSSQAPVVPAAANCQSQELLQGRASESAGRASSSRGQGGCTAWAAAGGREEPAVVWGGVSWYERCQVPVPPHRLKYRPRPIINCLDRGNGAISQGGPLPNGDINTPGGGGPTGTTPGGGGGGGGAAAAATVTAGGGAVTGDEGLRGPRRPRGNFLPLPAITTTTTVATATPELPWMKAASHQAAAPGGTPPPPPPAPVHVTAPAAADGAIMVGALATTTLGCDVPLPSHAPSRPQLPLDPPSLPAAHPDPNPNPYSGAPGDLGDRAPPPAPPAYNAMRGADVAAAAAARDTAPRCGSANPTALVSAPVATVVVTTATDGGVVSPGGGVLSLSDATVMAFRVMEAAMAAGTDTEMVAGWLNTMNAALERYDTDPVLPRLLSSCLRGLCDGGGRGRQVTQLALGAILDMLRRALGPRQPPTVSGPALRSGPGA